MASTPQFYSNYSFCNDFSQFQNQLLVSQDNYMSKGVTWSDQDISFPMYLANPELDLFQQGDHCNVTSSAPAVLMLPELIGMSSELDVGTTAVPTDTNVAGFCGIGSYMQNYGGRYQLQDVCEFAEECNGFVHHEFKPVDPTLGENWGIQGNRLQPAMEDNSLKVGRYSVEERKDRILKYLKKRNQRNFSKTIKYACRKTLADRRVRVRGRFARNSELCEEEMVLKKEDDNSPNEKNSCCWDSLQSKGFELTAHKDVRVNMKHDEDDCWLQEAMANLMYLPYITG